MGVNQMPQNKKSPFSLLLKLWLIFSTFTNIIALASLTDGLIAWSHFVRDMIKSYASIRDAVWGNLFSIFSFEMPKWTHDYFTINSIFAVSILWAIADAAQSISSIKLNSTFLYFKNSVLNITVGAELPISTAREAEKALAVAGLAPTSEQSKQLNKLARPIVSIYTVLKSVLMALIVSASYFSFAFLFPWIIQINDRLDARLATFEFRRLENKLRSISWQPIQLDILMKIFRSNVSQFAAFAAMDELFHETLQRSLFRYLIAVFILFLAVVFANQVLTAIL